MKLKRKNVFDGEAEKTSLFLRFQKGQERGAQ